MKYSRMAYIAWGLIPLLSSLLTAQIPSSDPSLAPDPADYSSLVDDGQVIPASHRTAGRNSMRGAALRSPRQPGRPVGGLNAGPHRSEGVPAPLSNRQPVQAAAVTMELTDDFAGPAMPGGMSSGCASPGYAGGCAGSDCPSGACGPGCAALDLGWSDCVDGSPCVPVCCPPVWQHRSGAFGEYLYLRPREAEIVYAVPIDGPINGPPANNPIQVGALGMVDPDYQSCYRAGIAVALSDCSSLTVNVLRYDSQNSDSLSTQPGQVLRSLVAHPSSTSAASDWLNASATYDIDFQFVDLDYSALWRGGDNYAINYVVGARYGKLEQGFRSLFSANGTETVSSDIDFEGGGIKLGLDLARYGCAKQLFVYSRGSASFLAGEFEATYFQGQSFDPTVADTRWDAGRIVTILDVEAGLGWRSQSGRWIFSSGYLVSAWLNTVKANQFIESVQQNSYLNLADDNFTFDGWVVRGEFRF